MYLTLILYHIFYIQFIYHQIELNENIYWHEVNKLKWEYYLERPSKNNIMGAISTTGIESSCNLNKREIKIVVMAFFCKTESWSKPELRTDKALIHEQGHFDIAEIHARLFRMKIIKSRLNSKNCIRKFNEIKSEVESKLVMAQKLYDKETEHHRNEEMQLKWNEKIKKELFELKQYQTSEINL